MTTHTLGTFLVRIATRTLLIGVVTLAPWPATKILAAAKDNAADLERGFKNPPASARPRVWWHWMNGNVTKEGITADLEWMKRVGIGGFQQFDASIGAVTTETYVDKRIVYRTPQWKEMLHHAAAEAQRLGLEMTMHSAGGWSETGGPWVAPQQAMKKLVWSETRVEGGRKFSGRLAPPPSAIGFYQDIRRPGADNDVPYQGDSAVIAYRVPDAEVETSKLRPSVTMSGGTFDPARLSDGDLNATVGLPIPGNGKPAWIQFQYSQPLPARALAIATRGGGPFSKAVIPGGEVEASQDGKTWVNLASMPGPGHRTAGLQVRTYSFPEMRARFFRVLFHTPVIPSKQPKDAPPITTYDIAELRFDSAALVNRWEDKAGFGIMFEYDTVATPAVPTAAAVAPDSVVDLTARMGKDGSLTWDVPPGTWDILRMGYSLTGMKNAPAPPEATGYEVDKLNRKHIEAYLRDYMAPISQALGGLVGKALQFILVDSWEAGVQNWTEAMLPEFRTRRGYDPVPYLPILTGRVVGSADVSDRFLWDFRRTIADMLADYHYEFLAKYLGKKGIKLYGEAAGTGNPMFQDALQNKQHAEIPMGEFWAKGPGQEPSVEHVLDIAEAASAAHIYGKPLVAAESFTSGLPGWNDPPSVLKASGDYFMTLGVNRFVIHTSVHQPFLDRKPGFTLGHYGQHYTRHNTWAEPSRAWIAYLSRSSHLLQQGRYVADIAYYYGEDVPVSTYVGQKVPPRPPEGYASDYVNSDVLLTRMKVKDGRLVLASGMSYRILVLPDKTNRMTPRVLRKIRDLVSAGAIVLGPRPAQSPSLTGYPACDDEVRLLANEVWGAIDGRTVTVRSFGKGKVYWGRQLEELLALHETPPDFLGSKPHIDTTLSFIHRQVGDADVYLVANQKPQVEDVTVRFRIDGKAAELWHPENGTIEPSAYAIEKGATTVPLHLGPSGSVFVVFRERAQAPSRTMPETVHTRITTLQGPWNVTFPPNQGAPASITLAALGSWTAHKEPGVKFFSGTASYTTRLDADAKWLRPGSKLLLDLGTVKELAEVSVNGKAAGIAWYPPFEVDVTAALQPGENRIEIKVTNTWQNRMIGDQFLPEKERFTFAPLKPYTRDSPLLEAGLLGPVTLSAVATP